MTLNQYVKKMDSKEAAAAQVGVSLTTLLRWLKKENKPQGNNARRLRELGVVT